MATSEEIIAQQDEEIRRAEARGYARAIADVCAWLRFPLTVPLKCWRLPLTIDEYREWYEAQPWRWRVVNRLRWKLNAIWSAIVGRPGPGERFILHAYGRTIARKAVGL